MTSTKLAPTLILGVIAAAVGTAAIAASPAGISDPLGYSAPETTAQRTIVLAPDTRYANVEQGETVKFVSQGKAFTWNFDTFGTPVFALKDIAPKDANVGNITVYVGPNRWYSSGAN